MIKKQSRSEVRVKKHMKVRNRFSGTAERPRLAVFRSNNHMYAQIIDDTVGNTLVSASTLQKDVKEGLEKTNNVEAAAKLGEVIAKKALVQTNLYFVYFHKTKFLMFRPYILLFFHQVFLNYMKLNLKYLLFLYIFLFFYNTEFPIFL